MARSREAGDEEAGLTCISSGHHKPFGERNASRFVLFTGMTKFYFIVREAGQVYQDTSGYGMDSLEKALQEAALLAVSLAKDHVAHDTNQAVCVEVLDDEGEMIGKSTCVVMIEQTV
jgi:hypothetical protein